MFQSLDVVMILVVVFIALTGGVPAVRHARLSAAQCGPGL